MFTWKIKFLSVFVSIELYCTITDLKSFLTGANFTLILIHARQLPCRQTAAPRLWFRAYKVSEMIITVHRVLGLANLFLPVGIETFLWCTLFREHTGSPASLTPLSGKPQQAAYSLSVSRGCLSKESLASEGHAFSQILLSLLVLSGYFHVIHAVSFQACSQTQRNPAAQTAERLTGFACDTTGGFRFLQLIQYLQEPDFLLLNEGWLPHPCISPDCGELKRHALTCDSVIQLKVLCIPWSS